MARRPRLIERREQLGLTQAEVAAAIGRDVGTVRRYELGLSTPRAGDRRPLAEVLQWSPAQLAYALADEPVPVNGHHVPGWLGHLASLEQAAGRLCAYEAIAVHGLCQTPDYAMAIERAYERPRTEESIAKRVQDRIARQAVLERRPEPLDLALVLDESALRRVAGNDETMADQLDHLVDVAQRPNVEVRVLPFGAGVFPFGSFALLTGPGATTPYMCITEDRWGPHYRGHADELDTHTALFDRLVDAALSPADTVDLLTTATKEYRR